MKPIQLLIALSIAFLIILPAVGADNQKVFTYDYGVRAQMGHAGGRAAFFGGTIMSIEAEPDGGWLPNKTYQLNCTLSLESVTPELLNGTDFYILVSLPSPQDTTPTIPTKPIVSQIQLSPLHKTGTLSIAYSPTNASLGPCINPCFPYTVYVNGKASNESWASGIWNGGDGLAIGITDDNLTLKPTASPTITTNSLYSIIAIAAALSILTVSALLIIKRVSTKRHTQQ